jgi:uncharacterized protein YegL
MSLLEKITPSPRKVMTLFYMIDTSESMRGSRIGTVNSAMEECRGLLREIANANDDAEIKVAVMQFSSGCSWLTSPDEPIALESWNWEDLYAEGITDFGAALGELDRKMSRNAFLKSQTGAYAPVILLFSDGGPTDNWKKGLEQIRTNNWFRHAIRIAIDIESGSDRAVLEAFTGNSEAILEAKDQNTLKKMIHKVSVRASEFQSHSKQSADVPTSPEEDAANIVKGVVDEIEEEAQNPDSEDWGRW